MEYSAGGLLAGEEQRRCESSTREDIGLRCAVEGGGEKERDWRGAYTFFGRCPEVNAFG